MSLDLLIHRLEIIVGKSLYLTLIVGFYIVTKLRKGSSWNLPWPFFLFFFWPFLTAFYFLGSKPFLTSSLSSPRKRKDSAEAFCLGIRLWINKETNICKTWVPRVSKTHMPLAVFFIKSKGHEWDLPKNNVNLPSFHFPIDNPNYLLWDIGYVGKRGKLGGDWRDTHKTEKFLSLETWLYLWSGFRHQSLCSHNTNGYQKGMWILSICEPVGFCLL